MKKLIVLIWAFISLNIFAETIVIYAPESMKWLEKEFKEDFKEKTGDEIKFIGMKGIVPRMKLEKNNPQSDVVLSLSLVSGELAKSEGLLEKYISPNLNLIAKSEYIMDEEGYITPFDYSLLGINYDRTLLKNPPKSFEELKKLKKQLLIQDPRSSTGQEIMLWTIAVYGDKWQEFWKELTPAILTTASGWDDSFAKFQTGEAPMMMGFATSNIFFYEEKNPKYDTIIPVEGAYLCLEGAGLTKKKNIKEGAKKFIDYLLTPEAQEIIMRKNYMLPVTDIKLENEFAYIPVSNKIVKLNSKEAVKNLEKWKKELLEILRTN
ncbi:MAG: thiamine ABC transporter substrate-binding protein [Fusobacteriaceae bacterium]